MKILLTNDDGYLSKGLKSLVKVMKSFGEVVVIAPKRPQSAVSLSVSMGYQPIAVKELGAPDGVRWLYLDGTPVSCVKFGIENLYAGGGPDIVVSGVNHGFNAATASCYSATLGAAAEAAVNGIPGVGVSLDSFDPDADFSAFEALFPDIFKKLMQSHDGKYGAYYNVNFPLLPKERIKGVRVCEMGIGHWERQFEEWDPEAIAAKGVRLSDYGVDPDKVKPEEGESLYYITGHFVDDSRNAGNADHRCLKEGYITVVEHNIVNSDRHAVNRLKDAGLETDYSEQK